MRRMHLQMRILLVSGSSRSGNTDFALKRIAGELSGKGADCEIIFLKDMNLGFYREKLEGTSMGMNSLYKKIFSADVLVLASPTYFSNVSGLMKNFMDWMNPYWQDERLKGKKVAAIAVGGLKSSAVKCSLALNEFARICRMKVVASLVFEADSAGELAKNKKAIREISKAAGRIIGKMNVGKREHS